MTVAELIEKLKGLPQDAIVTVPFHQGGEPIEAYQALLNPYEDYLECDYVHIN